MWRVVALACAVRAVPDISYQFDYALMESTGEVLHNSLMRTSKLVVAFGRALESTFVYEATPEATVAETHARLQANAHELRMILSVDRRTAVTGGALRKLRRSGRGRPVRSGRASEDETRETPANETGDTPARRYTLVSDEPESIYSIYAGFADRSSLFYYNRGNGGGDDDEYAAAVASNRTLSRSFGNVSVGECARADVECPRCCRSKYHTENGEPRGAPYATGRGRPRPFFPPRGATSKKGTTTRRCGRGTSRRSTRSGSCGRPPTSIPTARRSARAS